jgi:hypothetical protein
MPPTTASTGTGTTTIGGSGTSRLRPPNWLFLFGDSKTDQTVTYTTWPAPLTAQGNLTGGGSWGFSDAGLSGATLASTLAALTATLAGMPIANEGGSLRVLINLGVNDMGGLPPEATWEANYEALIDAIVAKWPAALVYLMRPWKVGFDAAAATLHSWIAVVQAARATTTFVGPDEAIWLKGSDNGSSETVDGIHYTPAGDALCVAQWQAVLGW